MMKTFKQNCLMLGTSVVGTTLLVMPATAATLDFKFSFDNELNGGGSVTGIVRGLEEGTGAATSVEVFSNTSGLGIGEYVGGPLLNSWTVTGGEVTAFNFLSAGIINAAPAVTDALIFFDSTELSGATFRAGVAPSPGPFVTGSGFVSTGDIGLSFSPFVEKVDPGGEPVPEPLTILGSIVALGLGVKMKKRMSVRRAA